MGNLQDGPKVEEVVTGGAIAFELENAARKYIHVYNLNLLVILVNIMSDE